VSLPPKFNRALIGRKNWKPVSAWAALGITPASGGKFNAPQAEAFVMIPQGINGPAFLVTKNFLAIMDYNLSHSYAVAVGHLGDRIRGGAAIQSSWPEVNFDLEFAERVEMQKRLSAMGFETGGSDGRFGARTYEAVIAFQRKVGLPLDGTPSRLVLERLRKGS
jgi:membrane-bound lytic murein transglycosylase B